MSKPPHPLNTAFEEELEKYWGRRWWVDSEFGRLRAVLVHRPGDELKLVDDPIKWLWDGIPNLEKAVEEHDELVRILEEEGVKVYYLDKRSDRPKLYFMRDPAVIVRGGAIIGRMSLEIRRGEERLVAERLIEIGVPILRTIHGYGWFEGGNLMFLDKSTVLIGEGLRTNEEGIDQVSTVLEVLGYEEVITVPIPGYLNYFPMGYVHLDVGLNFPDHEIAVVYPEAIPYNLIWELKNRGFKLIEVPREEALKMATNFLAVRPGRVIAAAGNNKTRRLLESEGIDVIEVKIDELMKGGGGVRCMTMPLVRDEV